MPARPWRASSPRSAPRRRSLPPKLAEAEAAQVKELDQLHTQVVEHEAEVAKLREELGAMNAMRGELDQARAETKEQQDELVLTRKALDRAGAQAAELRTELAQTQTDLDRARLEAQDLEALRAKLEDAELVLQEAHQSHAQTRERVDRLEAQLSAAQGAAFASERAADQLRQAQERMRDALAPLDEADDADPADPA